MNRRMLAVLVLVVVLAGCGEDTVTPDVNGETGPIDPYADPPDYSGDPFDGFPNVTGVTIPSGQVEVIEEEVLSGTHFTIQISAATTEEAAVRLAESVDSEITLPVFIDREGSYWKVRVGAFPARQDAVDYSQTLVDMGFTDAWVTTREP
ncbi:MAG: SPOR domain-containing protein [Candidatus Fermentibacteraceae bacterium]|nr:SPOR domain-containing protein [Candidatus Fermentibacteraceae bacterium]MBN2608598.1 SPOR domain-containing protein [Candidatus Fermentibacteraceae bacterium]